MLTLERLRVATACHPCDQGDDESHQEDEEQKLQDSGCGDCGCAKAEDCSNDCNNEKYQCPINTASAFNAAARQSAPPKGARGPSPLSPLRRIYTPVTFDSGLNRY